MQDLKVKTSEMKKINDFFKWLNSLLPIILCNFDIFLVISCWKEYIFTSLISFLFSRQEAILKGLLKLMKVKHSTGLLIYLTRNFHDVVIHQGQYSSQSFSLIMILILLIALNTSVVRTCTFFKNTQSFHYNNESNLH